MKAKLEKSCPDYITSGTVAKHCGVSKVTVLRWIENGILTAFKIPGGQNRIYKDDFRAFLAKYDIPVNKYTSANKEEPK